MGLFGIDKKTIKRLNERISCLEEKLDECISIISTISSANIYKERFMDKENYVKALFINGIYYIDFINSLRRLDMEDEFMEKECFVSIVGYLNGEKYFLSNSIRVDYKYVVNEIIPELFTESSTKNKKNTENSTVNVFKNINVSKDMNMNKFTECVNEAKYLMYLFTIKSMGDEDRKLWEDREDYKYVNSLANIENEQNLFNISILNYEDICKSNFNIPVKELLFKYREAYEDKFLR